MGTALPRNEPGEPCNVCWGLGQPFGDVTTPKFINMEFSGFDQGEFWDPDREQQLNASHLLEQTANPCTWVIVDSGVAWVLTWSGGVGQILIQQMSPFRNAFSTDHQIPCLLEYDNQIITPENVMTFGGKVEIAWSTRGL